MTEVRKASLSGDKFAIKILKVYEIEVWVLEN
jgi:hypothetical protein